MKIQLINSPLPSYISTCLRSKCYPPLHLISLATYIKNTISEADIEILDGEIIGKNRILEKANSDIIGISSNSLSYESAVEIATNIKKRNPNTKIILGGIHATNIAEDILNNRDCFDILVIGQGEQSITDILNNKPWKEISNYVFKDSKSKQTLKSFNKQLDINELPSPDYSTICLNDYFNHFQNNYFDKIYSKGIAVYSSTGCEWRIKSGGCSYCSIPNKNYSIISVKRYWKHIYELIAEFGIDFIWDVSDTFTSNIKWLESLVVAKPRNIDVGFHVYARIDNLDNYCISLLKQVGVKEVLIGIESFDNKMLKSAKKGFNFDKIIKSLNLLNEYKINVAISFVLGLPGEDEVSLKTTLENVKRISWMKNIIENHVSVLIPLPGSLIYREIIEDPILGAKYKGKDLLNFSELQRDYLDKFTICGSETVYDYYIKIDSFFRSAGPFYCDKNSSIYKFIHFKEELLNLTNKI